MKARAPAAALALLALVAGACSGSEGTADGPQPTVTVTLLTHDSFDVSGDVVRAFERDDYPITESLGVLRHCGRWTEHVIGGQLVEVIGVLLDC